MKEAMNKWLERFHQTFDADTAHLICDRIGIDKDKVDDCLGLCYLLDKGSLNEAEFTVALGMLAEKEPEEVMEILGGMKAEAVPEVKEPWQMTKEEFIANPPKGFKYDPNLREELLGYRETELTTIGDAFFMLSPEDRLSLLRHEEGHDLMINFNRDWKDVLEPIRKNKEQPLGASSRFDNPFGLSDLPEEIVADAYTSLWQGSTKWYGDPNYPANKILQQVIKIARREGKQLPSDLAIPKTEVVPEVAEPWKLTTKEAQLDKRFLIRQDVSEDFIARVRPDGRIEVGADFFDQPESFKRDILRHEFVHSKTDIGKITSNSFWDIVESNLFGKYDEQLQKWVAGKGFSGRNVNEALTQAVADYEANPEVFAQKFPQQTPIIKAISEGTPISKPPVIKEVEQIYIPRLKQEEAKNDPKKEGKENPMTETNEKLEAINKKWRELDELQIATHLGSMSARKWAVLNALDAIGLELTKGYVAIGSYIDEKMETIEMAIKDLKSSNEIDERY